MRLHRAAFLVALVGGALVSPAPAHALDFKVGKEQLRLDLTESMFLSWHLDNGNGKLTPNSPLACNGDCSDDNYGELINRLNAQLAWRRFLFSIRFDTGAWVNSPPLNLLKLQRDASKRYLSPGVVADRGPVPMGVTAFYLEKISASYIGRSVEVTLGDFYINLGRGLVLSIRKFDELGIDTTLTGAKLIVHEGNLNAIVAAGFTNLQNIDQNRAQWIDDPNDLIVAGHLDYRIAKKATVGANVMFGRPSCPSDDNTCLKSHPFDYEYHLRPGVSLDVPRLLPWLGIYGEYVRQQDRWAGKDGNNDARNLGNALYGVANLYLGDLNAYVEARWYDNYQQWHSTNDPFTNLVYMVPPNLARIIVPVNNNADAVGGRVRANYRFSRNVSAYYSAEVGRTGAEGGDRTFLLDFYGGGEVRWNDGRSHFFPLVGYRNEHIESNGPYGKPQTEERIIQVEWDAAQDLPRRLSLESQGLLWLRSKPAPGTTPGSLNPGDWVEGNTYLSLKWASKIVASAGFEWSTQQKDNQQYFVNGSLLWNITPGTSLGVFVGGNRPGLKCISGVCRVFPAFQGARVELVVRL